jgi:cadmium resistance protein CadD (predicted permease)
MAEDSRIGLPLEHEYDTLRHELLEAKRYVFERPLAITALAAIGLQVFDKPQHIALPLAVSIVTLFNFWFTVNRLQSASRIVAYIQLILEPTSKYTWIGWETSLLRYRMWLKSKGTRQANEYVDANVDLSRSPTTTMYYPPVYYFHGALIALSVLAGLVQFAQETTLWVRTLSLIPVGVGIWSLVYFRRWRPSRLRWSIERNRVIWQAALKEIGH